MVYIKGLGRQPIEMTRGDSETFQIGIVINGEEYTPQEGDKVRFALRPYTRSLFRHLSAPLMVKDVPINTMKLVFEPEDTKWLPFGKYKYDIQIVFADGKVKTFVRPSPFILGDEVY